MYDDHFVTFGSPEEIFPLVTTAPILSPLKPTDGRNLVNFAARDLVVSGFCWPETLELLEGKPLVLYQSLGRGTSSRLPRIPTSGDVADAATVLLNAVFLGPGH